MERFPTWQVWKLVHTFPSQEMYELLVRMLRVKNPAKGISFLSDIWIWTIAALFLSADNISLGFLYIDFSVWDIQIGSFTLNPLNFVLPAFITVVALRYALQVIDAIQREIGNYDLFAILPPGEFDSILNIARVYRHPLQGQIRGVKLFFALLLILGGAWLILKDTDFLPVQLLIFTVPSAAYFIHYLQTFVMATLIVIIINQHQQANAKIWLISSVIVIQVALYLGFNSFLELLSHDIYYRGFYIYPDFRLYYLWVIFGQPLIFIAVRELINFALWRAVKRRLEA